MIPLRGLTMFPHITLHFDVGRPRSIAALNAAMQSDQLVFLTAQKDVRTEEPVRKDVYGIGVVAEIRQVLKLPEGNLRVLVEGRFRARTLRAEEGKDYPVYTVAEAPLRQRGSVDPDYVAALIRALHDQFELYCENAPRIPKDVMLNAAAAEEPEELTECITGYIQLRYDRKQVILEQSDPIRRMEQLVTMLENENDVLGIEHSILDRVRENIDKGQREYFLREQMKVIAEELGEGEDVLDEAASYKKKLDALTLPADTRTLFQREIDKLRKMPPMSHESTVIRNYLDCVLTLPWEKETKDRIDIDRAARLLDRDHYGLEKVKERILELLAVRKLAPDVHGQIICLVGPPGTGKTSIARSIAQAIGRKYVRASLGGVRDEADIRGHRRTYIGAMPGRIIAAIRTAGVRNPLFLLDELDKLGSDFHGDPSSALLEVLDPEQNSAFVDHYVEAPFDLSGVLFIATANTTETIPPALLDRMEVIELPSYTREEKFQIARQYLLPRQRKENGLNGRCFTVRDDALYGLIDWYTREAGVRRLERVIASLCRKAAKKIVAGETAHVTVAADDLIPLLGPHRCKPDTAGERDEVGVVTGLAWTQVGGETMPVEAAVLPGSGKLELTGSLGDVMKESAHAAISCIRARTEELGIDPDFYKNRDIHIHVPEGAVPKDGPSAGVTMATAVVSALTGRPVRRDVAMTGEITLRGRVLAIGGLREKTMAAYRCGIRTVVIPEENLPDLDEVAPVVKEHIAFVPAAKLDTVLDTALCK